MGGGEGDPPALSPTKCTSTYTNVTMFNTLLCIDYISCKIFADSSLGVCLLLIFQVFYVFIGIQEGRGGEGGLLFLLFISFHSNRSVFSGAMLVYLCSCFNLGVDTFVLGIFIHSYISSSRFWSIITSLKLIMYTVRVHKYSSCA